MIAKFRINDLPHHRGTNEDGRVNSVYEEDGVTVYEVAVPPAGGQVCSVQQRSR
jgi:hypothetical protein